MTVIGIVCALKKRRDRRPGPVEGEHARVVHALAAAGEQLRRDPARALGRADEGHPARDRAAHRRRAALPLRAAAAAVRWKRRSAALAGPRRQAGRLRLLHADQAEGAAAAAPDDDHDDVRGGRPVGRRWSRSPSSAASCRAGGAGAFNHYYDRDIDAAMARTATRPVPAGRISPRAALIYAFALQVASFVILATGREPARRVPRPGRVRLVHGRLHALAQAPLAAEHRHRRRRRRGPAARRLGRGHGLASPPPRCICSRSSSTGRRRTSGRCRC